ncbi:hypothetical protein [Chitinophaga sp. YIM B06452]|uniref:hypothetical protein n=1 Tax=Chitinophaga sp. YIM B06452 TaxID=3082158 RepID=UPI0031FEE7ED
MPKELTLNVAGDRLIIEDRSGQLPELPPIPKRLQFSASGVLTSVYLFLAHREKDIDKRFAVVMVDRKALTIEAQTNPNNSIENDTVLGKIEVNPELRGFKINQVGSNFSRETLMGFLRTNRQYFPDKEAHGQLLSTVKNLKVNVNINASRTEDNRGNKANEFDKKVTAENVPVSTIIEIPVFVGEKPVRLALDICYDTTEQNVFFWFESAELNEVIYEASNERIEAEVGKIQELGFLVLEK